MCRTSSYSLRSCDLHCGAHHEGGVASVVGHRRNAIWHHPPRYGRRCTETALSLDSSEGYCASAPLGRHQARRRGPAAVRGGQTSRGHPQEGGRGHAGGDAGGRKGRLHFLSACFDVTACVAAGDCCADACEHCGICRCLRSCEGRACGACETCQDGRCTPCADAGACDTGASGCMVWLADAGPPHAGAGAPVLPARVPRPMGGGYTCGSAAGEAHAPNAVWLLLVLLGITWLRRQRSANAGK
jgi:hypothetical protein